MKGDALYMMELVLSLEKLNFHKLRLLHDIACKHDDAEMADFIGALLPLTVCVHDTLYCAMLPRYHSSMVRGLTASLNVTQIAEVTCYLESASQRGSCCRTSPGQ